MHWLTGLFVCAELRYFRLWLLCGIGLIIAVFYLSLVPLSVRMPAEHFDKLYHAFSYAVLMGWFIQLFRGQRSYLLLAVGFISMGALIEVLQSFSPMRYFDVLDMLANAVGVVIVWLGARSSLPCCLQWFERTVIARQRL